MIGGHTRKFGLLKIFSLLAYTSVRAHSVRSCVAHGLVAEFGRSG